MGVITLKEFLKQNHREIMKLQNEHKELFGCYHAPFDWESSTVGPQEWFDEFKRTVAEGRANLKNAAGQ